MIVYGDRFRHEEEMKKKFKVARVILGIGGFKTRFRVFSIVWKVI